MRPKDFPYERFLEVREKKEKLWNTFVNNEKLFVPVVQRPSIIDHYGGICRHRDKSLESQLDFLVSYLELKSDLMYSYLEPWHGVGIYASAFGCPLKWTEHTAPQTVPIYYSEEDIKNYKMPDISKCEIMQTVLDSIKYFREQTGDMLEISLTDTQSPNDNASLIMDACEFFVLSVSNPQALYPFLGDITDTMIQFTNLQIEALGKTWSRPGHSMISSLSLKGISVSDDNMAVISPEAYRNTVLPFNNRLSRNFGGIAVHSCGNFAHNTDLLLKTEGLSMIDCAIGSSVDPTPNNPGKLREGFAGTDVILKVRLGVEEINLLEDLVDKDLKLIVEIRSQGNIAEKNRHYEMVKQKIEEIIIQKDIS